MNEGRNATARQGLVLLGALLAALAADPARARDPVPPPAPADAPLLTWEVELGELAHPGPSLRVHADGRAVAHYPVYMKRAGDHAIRLAPGELAALVASVSVAVEGFEAEAVRARVAEAEAARASAAARAGTPRTVEVRTDVGTTRITLRSEGRERRAAWPDLRHDVRRHPEVAALQRLGAADAALRALLDRCVRESPGQGP